MMQYETWNFYKVKPNYIPKDAQRVFVDLTETKARKIALSQIANSKAERSNRYTEAGQARLKKIINQYMRYEALDIITGKEYKELNK